MLLYGGCQGTAKYPGVAKFGIALEWGSRGRWFESSHSDQKRGNVTVSSLFLLCTTEPAASCCAARRISIRRMEMPCEALHFPLVRIQSLGPKERKRKSFLSFSFLLSKTSGLLLRRQAHFNPPFLFPNPCTFLKGAWVFLFFSHWLHKAWKLIHCFCLGAEGCQ